MSWANTEHTVVAGNTAVMANEIAATLASNEVRYSQVWEDHALVEHGLAIGPDDDVLSITSAGDNVLALLLQGPRSITAIDLNEAQGHLLALKLAAIRCLDHHEMVALLGFGAAEDTSRGALYARIRRALPRRTRSFWDARVHLIDRGVARTGKLEDYFLGFAEVSPLPPTSPTLRAFLQLDDIYDQREAFARDIATPEFEATFRAYFGRESMAAQGRDPAQFRYVREGDVGAYFWDRFTWVCTHLPVRTNFYLRAFLTGDVGPLTHGPVYLRPESFDALRASIDRVTIVTDEIETLVNTLPAGTFSKLNLSDMFEYVSETAADRLFEALGTWVRPGGRIAYWNLLVPRTSPLSARDHLRPLRELSAELWRRDRSWFYRDFHIEEVR